MRPKQSNLSARAWSPKPKLLIKSLTSHKTWLCRIHRCSTPGQATQARCKSTTRVLSTPSSSTRYLLGAIHLISQFQEPNKIYQIRCSKTKIRRSRDCIWVASLALKCRQEAIIMKMHICQLNKEKSSRNSKSAHLSLKLILDCPGRSQTTVKVVEDLQWVHRSRKAMCILNILKHVRLTIKLEVVRRESVNWGTG